MGWYYLGGVTMFFFIVQVITGVLLLMYFPAGRSDCLREYSFPDDQSALRLADSLDAQLERASDDHLAGAPHV